MKEINLGRKVPNHAALSPLAKTKPATGENVPPQTVEYPSLHIHGSTAEHAQMHKMPEKGVMKVHYTRVSHGEHKSEDGKGTEHSAEFKIHKIIHAAPHAKEETGEQALDRLAKSAKSPAPDSDADETNDTP